MSFQLEPFLKISRAPGSGGRLSPAPDELIKLINESISAGAVVDQAGQKVVEQIEAGLIDNEQNRLFPIRGGIAILVSARAIELNGMDCAVA